MDAIDIALDIDLDLGPADAAQIHLAPFRKTVNGYARAANLDANALLRGDTFHVADVAFRLRHSGRVHPRRVMVVAEVDICGNGEDPHAIGRLIASKVFRAAGLAGHYSVSSDGRTVSYSVGIHLVSSRHGVAAIAAIVLHVAAGVTTMLQHGALPSTTS